MKLNPIRPYKRLRMITTFAFGNLRTRPPHHPATLVLAFGLKVKHAHLLQLLKSHIPELQVQNFALTRQKIIIKVEPQHRLRCRRSTAVEISSATSAVSLPPSSIACSVAYRNFLRSAFSSALPCSYHCEVRAYKSQQ